MKYLYLLIINIAAFAAMGIDKSRARNHQWRISEAALFSLALLGGSVGSIAGMRFFHHKTRKPVFRIGMPLILVVQILAVVYLARL